MTDELPPLPDLESQDFYEVMQAYRYAPPYDQRLVIEKFDAVKAWVRAYAAAVAPERKAENVIRLALMHAAFNAPETSKVGDMRDAAVQLFGTDAVDAAIRKD